ncbi:phage tail assembly chaperone [Streptomyces hygroscopicus]|uniref:phage tail assembly chaperone n=1 Tax=Streptomyces hygroscopicus TaxID=1912 RepID=UPI00223F6279|nr:phage tail assembly chaperone [Streptomyces hygroscopicus]
MLSRDQILNASDLTIREVPVPEWGGTVHLKALTGRERDAWEASNRILRGSDWIPQPVGARARLLVRAIVDETGQRIFEDKDAAALGEKSGSVIDRLFDIAAELSGVQDSAVEEAAGNSEAALSGSSTSDSPENSAALSMSY